VETDDSNSVKFAGHPDAETYLALVRFVRPQKAWSTSGLVVIGLTVFAAIGFMLKNGIPLLPAVVLILIVVSTFSLLPSFKRRQMGKHQKRTYTEAMQKLTRTGLVSPKGIHIKFADGQTELCWSHFDQATEISGAIGLCKGREVVDALSRSMFESEDEWNAARRTVLKNVPSTTRDSSSASR
jgi:hypothetical protein